MDKGAQQVKAGQVWADNDPRAAGRTIRVLNLVPSRGHGGLNIPDGAPPRYARCLVLTDRAKRYPRSRSTVGRIIWIKLDRFRPTSSGYRLVEDTGHA